MFIDLRQSALNYILSRPFVGTYVSFEKQPQSVNDTREEKCSATFRCKILFTN